MVEKLRKNYSLSLWLTRLFFYISFVFCNWFDIESAINYMSYAGLFGLALERSFWLVAASGLIGAVITEVLIWLILRFVFYVSKIVMVPRNEFTVLFLLCLIPINLILGALNLLFYLTPLVISWGSVLFEFVVATPFLWLFFVKTKQLYFNDKAAPYYFKVFAIAYLIYFGLKLVSVLLEAL